MAWTFRADVETMQKDLADLAKVGIVHQDKGCWIVTHFVERQDNITPAEGMARLRERRHKAEYYVPAKSAPESAQPAEVTPPEQPPETPAASQDINTPSEEPVNEPLINLTQIRLDKIRLDSDQIRSDPPREPIPPNPTPQPAPRRESSFSNINKFIRSVKLPVEPNEGLTRPEIYELTDAALKIWAEICHPVKPDQMETTRIIQYGNMYGYQRVLEAFRAAKGKCKTLSEISHSLELECEGVTA
jgi:hypothetical protein